MAVEENYSTPNKGAADTKRGELTLVDFFQTVKKHWITAAVTFLVCIVATCIYTFITPPKYSATTQLFASYSDSATVNNDSYSNINSASTYVTTQIKSYPTLAKTSSVLSPVIQQLGLNMTTSELGKYLSVTNPTNTAFVNVTATMGNAELARKVSDAVAESLINVVQSSLYSNDNQSPVKLSIVQPAETPTSPTSPKVKLYLLIGLLGGIVLGIIAAILKDMFTRKIQSDTELESYIDAPVLGRIPSSEVLAGKSPVVIAEPGGPIAEEFRRICTNLSFIVPVSGTNARLIVVSAVGASEGKTTTSVNLATTLAENGARVLLIDADLRHPSVAKKLEIDGSAGLAHVLSGQAAVKDVVQRYWKPNLHIMPAGPKPPNAAVLLNSPIMSELINQALHQYDYVIVDTAPLLVANEAALYARQGGGLVLVSRRGATLKSQLTRIAEELNNLNVTTTGFIFNYAKENKKHLAGDNYYYYSSTEHTTKKRTSKK